MFKYKELISFFKKAQGLSDIYSFASYPGQKNGLILRHDIDVSVEKAYDLAQIEADLNITSSILFLTSCPTYNINTIDHRKKIKRLSEQGFDVGLHFDPTLYATDDLEILTKYVHHENQIIENITGKNVKTISLHCPSIHNMYPIFEGFHNGYDPQYFNPENYLSDSRMGFRGKDPMTFIEKAKTNLIQVLLHPFHYSEEGGDYQFLFRRFLKEQAQMIDGNFRPFNDRFVQDLQAHTLADFIS